MKRFYLNPCSLEKWIYQNGGVVADCIVGSVRCIGGRMRVIDIISMVDDYTATKVVDAEGVTISEYNGRDSIDTIYNNMEVGVVSACNDTLYLYV